MRALAGAVMSNSDRQRRGVRAGVRAGRDGSGRRSWTVIEGRDDSGVWARRSNNAGGLEAASPTASRSWLRGAVKPISTLSRPLPSADLITGPAPSRRPTTSAANICRRACHRRRRRGDGLSGPRRRGARQVSAGIRWPRRSTHGPIPGRAGTRSAGGRRPRRPRPAGSAGAGPVGRRVAGRGPWSWWAPARQRQERCRAPSPRTGTQAPVSSISTTSSRFKVGKVRARESFAEGGRRPDSRRHEREAVLSLGPADPAPELRRVIASGGRFPSIDPRKPLWLLYRGRLPIWARQFGRDTCQPPDQERQRPGRSSAGRDGRDHAAAAWPRRGAASIPPAFQISGHSQHRRDLAGHRGPLPPTVRTRQ